VTTVEGRDRAAAAFLLAVLAIGCLALFIGVPIAVLWGLSNLTDSFVTHFVLGLIAIPVLIALLSPALFWVNGLYLRVTATAEPEDEEDWAEDEDRRRFARGPLEPMLVAAFVVALTALIVWFFFFAENPVLTA
jgi:hypothetical protein